MARNSYPRILLNWWWLVAAVAGIAVAATAVLVSRQPESYSSSATFVVRPSADDDEAIRVLDTLSRRVEILSTYADISESTAIKNQAIARLAIDEGKRKGLSISSRVVAGTNILRIVGEASQAQLAQDFTGAVADETLAYISELNDIFTLQPLDPPSFSSNAIGPRTRSTLVLGGILGLALGAGLAVLAELVWRKPDSPEEEEDRAARRLQDEEVGTYGRRYFGHLISQAALRVHRGGEIGFTVAAYGNADDASSPSMETLQAVATSMDGWLRPEDVLAHFGDGCFSVLLPHTEPQETETHVERYRLAIEQVFRTNGAEEATVAVGTVTVPIEDTDQSELVDGHEIITMALQALTVARVWGTADDVSSEPDDD